MQFSTLSFVAFFVAGAFAAPSVVASADIDADVIDARGALEGRANCNQILPACFGGRVQGQTNCRCKGQKETCDLWTCPGGAPNVMVCGQAGTGCVWI